MKLLIETKLVFPSSNFENEFFIFEDVKIIDKETKTEKYGYIYRVWLMSDKWLQSANQEAYELASLEHLRELGVRI